MPTALLDTTFFIDLHRGDSGALDLWNAIFSRQILASYSPLTTFELWWGNLRQSEADFYEGIFYFLERAELTDECAKSAANWIKAMNDHRAERLIRDALIAASAIQRGEVVYTRNTRDFSLFPVKTESY